jgi:hypothetical protein
VATEAAWLNGNNLEKEETKKKKEKRDKMKESLDTHRPPARHTSTPPAWQKRSEVCSNCEASYFCGVLLDS